MRMQPPSMLCKLLNLKLHSWISASLHQKLLIYKCFHKLSFAAWELAVPFFKKKALKKAWKHGKHPFTEVMLTDNCQVKNYKWTIRLLNLLLVKVSQGQGLSDKQHYIHPCELSEGIKFLKHQVLTLKGPACTEHLAAACSSPAPGAFSAQVSKPRI